MDKIRASKFLSLVLRHKPERIGLSLDREGWVAVTDLLSAMARAGRPLTRDVLDQIVSDDKKQRYAFNDERTRIRANQGHSVSVEIAYDQMPPPDELFHGTTVRYVDSIMVVGLTKQARNHVHLSADAETASVVGARHGKHVVLRIDAAGMHAEGHTFYRSANGVWLVDRVPAKFLSVARPLSSV